MSQMPLDFIYDRKENRYTLERYKNNEDLVKKIQTGKGDEIFRYNGLGKNIWIEQMFGGTTPRIPQQDYIYGDNDLTAAKAYRYKMRIERLTINYGYTENWKFDYEYWLYEQIVEWG